MYFFFQHGTISLGKPGLDGLRVQPLRVRHDPEARSRIRARRSRSRDARPPTAPTWLTLFTSMFMHGGLLHLGGNMLFLWIFGNNVEDSMGPVKFLVFYVLGGLAADAAQIVSRSELARCRRSAPRARSRRVLGGYLLLFPRARVVTVVFIIFFFTILELPAILFLGIWILQQAPVRLLRPHRRPGRRAASRTSRTSAASCSGCWRSGCSRASDGAAGSWSG